MFIIYRNLYLETVLHCDKIITDSRCIRREKLSSDFCLKHFFNFLFFETLQFISLCMPDIA